MRVTFLDEVFVPALNNKDSLEFQILENKILDSVSFYLPHYVQLVGGRMAMTHYNLVFKTTSISVLRFHCVKRAKTWFASV